MENANENEMPSTDKRKNLPHLFKKGGKGGPGRPKKPVLTLEQLAEQKAIRAQRREVAKRVADIRLAAKEYTDEALGGLVGVLRDPLSPAGAIVSAASELLDRGWGKATQIIAGDEKNPVRIQHTRKLDITGLSDEQLDALEQALERTILTIEHDPNEKVGEDGD